MTSHLFSSASHLYVNGTTIDSLSKLLRQGRKQVRGLLKTEMGPCRLNISHTPVAHPTFVPPLLLLALDANGGPTALAAALPPGSARAAFLVWLDQKFNKVTITSEQVSSRGCSPFCLGVILVSTFRHRNCTWASFSQAPTPTSVVPSTSLLSCLFRRPFSSFFRFWAKRTTFSAAYGQGRHVHPPWFTCWISLSSSRAALMTGKPLVP